MKKMVQTDDLIFEYAKRDEEGNVIGSYRAIDQVNLEVERIPVIRMNCGM